MKEPGVEAEHSNSVVVDPCERTAELEGPPRPILGAARLSVTERGTPGFTRGGKSSGVSALTSMTSLRRVGSG